MPNCDTILSALFDGDKVEKDLTRGSVTKSMLLFAYPMILGNLLQQCYNIADTLIVGRFLGADALAAVGSAYTLMTFLISVIAGFFMGGGAVFSVCKGRGDEQSLKNNVAASFVFIAVFPLVRNICAFLFADPILHALRVPDGVYPLMRKYVITVFFGIFFTFLYNYFAFLLRALGNSVVPLYFLGVSAAVNIVLDILFVVKFGFGVTGAAAATVTAEVLSGVGIMLYVYLKVPSVRPKKENFALVKKTLPGIARHSLYACVQQSVMNFGILMIQGLVNSFGTVVMAAFAAAVKIDTLAYMPAQEFGNAFSLFISQNYGGGKTKRVREGVKKAFIISFVFCAIVSVLVFIFAPSLMKIFVSSDETAIIETGKVYLRIEGSFYCGIGILFLLYGYFRGTEKPEISLLLTVISLGTRVLLAYITAPVPKIGVNGIWWAVPIGWFLADITGIVFMAFYRKREKKSAER